MGFIDNLSFAAREARKKEILKKFEPDVEPIKESVSDRAARFAREEIDNYAEEVAAASRNREKSLAESAARLNNIRSSAITECFMSLWNKSASDDIVNDEFAKSVARSAISAQIMKEGSGLFLTKMKGKSVAMCDMAGCVETLLEKCSSNKKCDDDEEDEECKEKRLAVDPATKSEFFDDVDNVADTDDITQSIKSRVADAVSTFVNSTAANKAAIEDVINDIKEKTANTNTSEEVKEEYRIRGNAAISRINHRDTNLFGKIVKNMSESALVNDKMKAVLVENGKINFNKIMTWAESVYTVMEMFNTTKMIKFTPEYVAEIANSFKV